MGIEETIPSKANQSPSPEARYSGTTYLTPPCYGDNTPRSLSTSASLSASTREHGSKPNKNFDLPFKKKHRSQSLPYLFADAYTPGEIRRIRERLLRTNSHLEPSAIKKLSREQKMTLASLALVDFMCFCSMSIMAPFFPKEAAEKGMSESMCGFIFSFYALVMFLTSPIFGKTLPRMGAKFLFLTGMFTAGACNLLFGMLEFIQDYTLFMTFCLIIRGLGALGATAFSTACYVFVVHTFPSNIGSVLGILETFVGLGMSTGPAIGGLLYSLGGFDLPFFVLGITMILIIPLNMWLLPNVTEVNVDNKSASFLKIIKVPAVFLTGCVVVVTSSAWAFLDPTLEPHLREFNLSPEKVGLIFLLFSALYGISSPAWGWLVDRTQSYWVMMIAGLFFTSIGLFLLGPCPYLPFLQSSLWLNLVSLSIMGIAVALALLPTFQTVLTSAMEAGFRHSISTYSVVAGVWSCMYSLGEVVGPLLGGYLLEYYGFPMTSTIMGIASISICCITLIYYLCKKKSKYEYLSDSEISDATWKSGSTITDDELSATTPLLMTMSESNFKLQKYTEDKVQYYEHSRRLDNEVGDVDSNQVTDARGTVNITATGACEV